MQFTYGYSQCTAQRARTRMRLNNQRHCLTRENVRFATRKIAFLPFCMLSKGKHSTFLCKKTAMRTPARLCPVIGRLFYLFLPNQLCIALHIQYTEKVKEGGAPHSVFQYKSRPAGRFPDLDYIPVSMCRIDRISKACSEGSADVGERGLTGF